MLKQAKTRENRRKTGAFLVLIFLGKKLVGANFYAFCNYVTWHQKTLLSSSGRMMRNKSDAADIGAQLPQIRK